MKKRLCYCLLLAGPLVAPAVLYPVLHDEDAVLRVVRLFVQSVDWLYRAVVVRPRDVPRLARLYPLATRSRPGACTPKLGCRGHRDGALLGLVMWRCSRSGDKASISR